MNWMKASSPGLLVVCLLVVLVTPALAQDKPTLLPVPVVFTSRNHLDTIDGVHVGPPVEILGREKIAGGKLMVLYPEGRLQDLTSGKLLDVARPMVSFDGKRIVFSGVRSPREQWHIFEINLDGTGLRQLTFDDREITIPTDPENPRRNQNLFGRYGDFSPAYLPDGRIIFASSRYPALSGSCGQRALNLYVMNADGTGMHRITTERAGAIDPYVLADGRVIFSHWVDNMNVPAPAGPGLRPLEAERNFAPSFWIPWATNPDGTGAGRYAFNGGKFQDKGGIFQAREMPNGDIVYSYRSRGSLLGHTLPTSIALMSPGAGERNSTKGIGDPTNLEGSHALSPTPLPDGRVVFSYTPEARVTVDSLGRTTARFDYGLYITDSRFQEMRLVFDLPGTDELDAVAVYPRTAKVIPDIPLASLVSDDPTVDLKTTVTLHNYNIYADLPPDFREILSPLVSSVVAVDFHDDSQTFATSPDFPLPRKQPPTFLGSVPVNPDGSFTATVPADRPIFWLLRTTTGVVARAVAVPPGETQTSFVPTHDYFRPGTRVECVGCHRGHMINPALTFTAAQTNLARFARAKASSTLGSFYYAPFRVNDNRVTDEPGRYDWASRGEKTPWVSLHWDSPVTVREVVIYPRITGGNRLERATLYFGDGSRLSVSGFHQDGSPLKLSFPPRPVSWLRLQVEAAEGPSIGVAEILVYGDNPVSISLRPPSPPRELTATQETILLNWRRNTEPDLGGYRIYYGVSPGQYTTSLDVGNVNRFLTSELKDGQTYYFAIKAYNLAGMESPGFSNEVSATFYAPQLLGVSPASGSVFGGTEVTLTGQHLASRGLTVLFGPAHAPVVSATAGSVTVLSPPYRAGPVDITLINSDGSPATLPSAFTYIRPR